MIRSILFRGERVVLPGGVGPASLVVRDGRIESIHAGRAESSADPAATVVDAGRNLLLPGLVDTHVHVNEPGRTEWEGFDSATRAAAAGGITTLVDMPLNSIPATTSAAALAMKQAAARSRCHVDVAFWGGAVPGNRDDLAPLHAAGVAGFKSFLVESGVAEFAAVGESDLREALREVARLGSVLLAHAELPGPIAAAAGALESADWRRHVTWLGARPRAAENEAVELLIRLARETGARVHVVHLSSSDALPALRAARDAGLPITVETCPHYLCLPAEAVPDGATAFKCAPPLREDANREALWAGLEAGTIDLIASDHSPSPPELKALDSGRFDRAWGGISSVQLGLPLVWSELLRRGLAVDAAALRVARWMSAAPAQLAGLAGAKGVLTVGAAADFVEFDPDAEWRVEPERLFHRHKLTPYAGRSLRGAVRRTFLGGRLVYDGSGFPAGATGRLLERPADR